MYQPVFHFASIWQNNKEERLLLLFLFLLYAPTQLVAPRAVRMADAMEAISWITNFTVSFFVILV